MKFIAKDGSSITINEKFSIVSKDTSPFKEIVQRKDFSDYIFIDDKTISLSKVTQIQVNVIEIGIMIFVFEKVGFDKDMFISEVQKLKELPVSSFYDVINKMKSLYQVVEPFNPLFAIYNPIGKYKIYDSCFETVYSNIKTIYLSSDGRSSINIDESKSEKDTYQKTVDKVKSDKKEKFKFVNPIPIIAKDKFHFLFALIATFLLGFTCGIGIHDAYAGKMLCVFFFICALAGSFLNFMIYKDTFKNQRINSFYSLLTLIASLIGLGLSIGAYILFSKLSKDVLQVSPHIFMIIAINLALYLISASSPLLVSFIKNRKK